MRTLAPSAAKKSPVVKKKLAPKRDTAWAVSIVGLCVLAALVLWSGNMVTELSYRLQVAERNLVEVLENRDEFCARSQQLCIPSTNEPREVAATSSMQYVLDAGVSLSREWRMGDRQQELWLIKNDDNATSASSVRMLIGTVDAAEDGVRMQPFSIERLSNGLYKFVATADYIETGSEVMGLIDSETQRFITFTAPGDGQEIAVSTPEITKAIIGVHLGTDNCATSLQAVVDRLDWNNEVLYQFRKPPTIRCAFNEMKLGNVLQAFADIKDLSVTRDLRSVVLRLQTGQALRLQFSGAKKPTVTVVQ